MTVWDWLIVIAIVTVADIVLAPLRLHERSAAAGTRFADAVVRLLKRGR